MPWKKMLSELSQTVRTNADKITKAIPENLTKTQDLRIDIHQDSKNINKAVAKIPANAQAEDNAVKDYIKSENKGGGHKGIHKTIAEIPFDRTEFDVDDFTSKIENARK